MKALYLNFCLDFSVVWKNGLTRKIRLVNFKIDDITAWLKSNYNTLCPISHEVDGTRQ